MFTEFFEKFFGTLNLGTKSVKSSVSSKHVKSIKNATLPIELKSKNIVMPDNKTEKEIQTLYAEIRELQAQNREKINKNRFVCL